jgi:hypothetical protein
MRKYLILLVVFGLSGISFLHRASAGSATLSLSPTAQTVGLNQTFTVNVNLDTAGGRVDGVDIYSLHFSPSVLQVVQVLPGNLFANTVVNSVNNSTGVISFAQTSAGGTYFSGSGVLAQITFRSMARGSSNVTFDFTPGSTTDTNVTYQGIDQLSAVTNAKYTVTRNRKH